MESFYDRLKTIEQDPKWLKETEEYRQFVREDLGNLITYLFGNNPEEIICKCFNCLEILNLEDTRHMLIFLKKYMLIEFYTTLNLGVMSALPQKSLNSDRIKKAYEKELAHVNEKPSKITKPSIFERLAGFTTMEEREEHIQNLARDYEESLKLAKEGIGYNQFIMDRENGLYSLLEQALVDFDFRGFFLVYDSQKVNFKFIEEFCGKYGIELNMRERNEKVNIDLLNIKTIDEVRYLFQCFFDELQKIEHFSKSSEQLWQENIAFVNANKEWIEERIGRRG